MEEAYQATIGGKNYFLYTIGEKQRAMVAITRLLRWGNPLKTKGPEGAEQSAEAADESGETPPAETSEPSSEEGGGEESETLEESVNILKQIINEFNIEEESTSIKEASKTAASKFAVDTIVKKYTNKFAKSNKVAQSICILKKNI
jgi:hypothetical protein